MNQEPQPPALPGRKLRLSAILTELCEGAEPALDPAATVPSPDDPSIAAEATAAAPTIVADEPHPEPADPPVVSMTTSMRRRLLPRLHRKPRIRSNITIGEIVDRTARAGFGFIFAFLALVSIPFVGLSTPFGLAIAFGAVQMIGGFGRPWLPQRVRRHAVSMQTLNWLSHKLARWTAGLEKFVKPRFELLTRGPFWTLCGLGVLIQALGLALPLPIPGSNWPFIFLIVLYAIGLLELDGLLIMICHALSVVEIVLAIKSWEAIQKELIKVFHWIGTWFGAG